MKRLSAREFIQRNGLCEGVKKVSGIYAITIDNRIVYIGRAKNMESRTRGHIRHMINGCKTKKYGLLNDIWFQKHKAVDCHEVKECAEDELDNLERTYIDRLYLPLNTSDSRLGPNPKGLTSEGLLAILDRCEEW